MTSDRFIRIAAAGLACGVAATLPAPAVLGGEWELDYEYIAESGQRVFEQIAPASVQEQFRFYTAAELRSTFGPIETALAGGSLEALSALQPRARQTLDTLRANPETQG